MLRARGRRHGSAIAAALAAGLVLLTFSGEARGLDYVALGDSVASGYGLAPAASPCFRAAGAYPLLVRDRLRERRSVERFTFLACSGAQAVGEAGARSLRVQVGRALDRIRGRPTLVSITIGINDLEWWNLARARELLDGDRAAFEAWLRRTVSRVRSAVGRELERLLARRRVAVILTEYYDPFNRGSPLFRLCEDAGRCRSRTSEVVAALNRGLRALARPRVRVAAVEARFRGHEGARPLCGSLPPGASATWIQDDCLHPNRRGSRAIARAVERAASALRR